MNSSTVIASRTFIENSTVTTKANVMPWTARLMRPSENSCWRASMSEVILVMILPAFSSVKKFIDNRWMCEKTRMRRLCISVWPR